MTTLDGAPVALKDLKRARADSASSDDVQNVRARCENAGEVAVAEPPPPPPSYEIHFLYGGLVAGAQEVVVGERVQLRLVGVNGGVVTNPLWALADHHVGGYTNLGDGAPPRFDVASASVTATVLNQDPVTFHWISPGDKTVNVLATLNGVDNTPPSNNNLAFRVVAPEVSLAQVQLKTAPRISTLGGQKYIVLRTAGNAAGMKMRFRVRRAALGNGSTTSGRVACIQLVRTNDYQIVARAQIEANYVTPARTGPAPGLLASAAELYYKEWLGSTANQSYLDTACPYGAARILPGGGNWLAWSAEDSPNSPLYTSLTKVHADDRFRVYFMFRSVNPGSIWVTLYVADWRWQAVLERAPGALGSEWANGTAIQQGHPPGAADIDANPSHELPVWTAIANAERIDFDSFTNNPHA